MHREVGMDATSLVSAWDALVLQLAFVFTEGTAATWRQIALGWLLHRGPATVTGIIRTLGRSAEKHWTVYHKFFYRAAWSLETLSLYLMTYVIGPLIIESGVTDSCGRKPASGKPVADLAIDDTTAARYGKHVAHAGWFKDASATGPATKGTVIHWAHNWITGVITLRLPKWGPMRWVLPAVFALYRKSSDCTKDHPFRNRQTLAAELVQQAVKALPDVQLRVSADGQYATRDMVRRLPEGVNLVSRIRRDAALYALLPKRRRRQRGRPRKKGRRLPTPAQTARRRTKGWRMITVHKQGCQVRREVLGLTCLWYHVCKDVPIRLVIVRDPAGRQKDDFFFCTDAHVPEEQIVQRYCDRWGVEESYREGKQFLGFETVQGWCSKTVLRQAPLALVLTTLVKAWYARCAAAEPSLLPKPMPWYPDKAHPSFADMLSALRGVLWRHRLLANSPLSPRVRKILKGFAYALSEAA